MANALFQLVARLPAPLRRLAARLIVVVAWALYVRSEVRGREHIPQGPCLFISNHLSNADALVLSRALAPKQVLFLAGVKLQDTLMTRLGLELVQTIPIRPNSPDVEALKRAVEALKSGQSVLVFPEGGRSRTGSLIQGKKGAALIAKRSGVPVVPVAMTGTDKLMPINDTDMGGERPRRAAVTVSIGRPFAAAELAAANGGEEDERQAMADAMMRRVAELLPPQYRGVYS